MSPARKTRSSARAAAAAGTQINNNDKKVNRKLGNKRMKILMDDNISKTTKFQVTKFLMVRNYLLFFFLLFFDGIFCFWEIENM